MRLTADLIRSAKDGDPQALRYLQKYFENYITSLSSVGIMMPNGTVLPYLDQDIREELREAVIEGTLKFDESRITASPEPNHRKDCDKR